MKLSVCNVDSSLLTELIKWFDINYSVEESDVLFIDWIPTTDKTNPNKLIEQVKTVDSFVKEKKPIILFDRFLSLTFKEQKYLKKTKTFFLEPALNFRRDFSYLPAWIDVPYSHKEMSLASFDKEKKIDVAFLGNSKGKIDLIEKEISYLKEWRDCSVGFESTEIEDVINNFSVDEAKTVLVVCTEKENNIGYLDPYLNTYLKNGVVPYITRGKYFKGIFSDSPSIKNIFNMVDNYDKFAFGHIWDIYERILNWYPEMTVNNTAKNITQIGERLLK